MSDTKFSPKHVYALQLVILSAICSNLGVPGCRRLQDKSGPGRRITWQLLPLLPGVTQQQQALRPSSACSRLLAG